MELYHAFLAHVRDERGLADNTVEAYGADLAAFFGFLTGHLGEETGPRALASLGARDIRAYLARRRRDGLSDASIARALSSIKALSAKCENPVFFTNTPDVLNLHRNSEAWGIENVMPTEQEARYYLAGNLCRCTGYDKIIRAVMDAAAELRGESA